MGLRGEECEVLDGLSKHLSVSAGLTREVIAGTITRNSQSEIRRADGVSKCACWDLSFAFADSDTRTPPPHLLVINLAPPI